MSRTHRFPVFALLSAAAALALACAGCGGAPSASPIPTPSTTPNVQPIQVNAGPAQNYYTYSNGAFTSVTLCVPGTTTCQTIGGILVDTGSEGLRVLASALTISLPQQTQNGDPVGECAPFVDGVAWGPVVTADVQIAGEKGSSVPIEVVGGSSGLGASVPAPSCTDQGTPDQDLPDLGANGILGIGPFAQDCGVECTSTYPISSGQNLEWYYTCPGNSSSNCTPAPADLMQQVVNPVVTFPTDNNGVVIELPALSGSPPVATGLSGSLIFGIGTQSNNGLGNATIYQIDPMYGNFSTVFNSVEYSDAGFIDSGSNAYFFADSTTTNMPYDANSGLYTPPADEAFSATNVGYNGATGTFNFTVESGDGLFNSYPNDTAFADLAGPSTYTQGPSSYDYFDWGLPFFYGRTVFTAIEGAGTPGGTGPFFAY